MTTKPRRRWFAFSLRTLFVLVTMLSVWLGWNVRVVQTRKAVRQSLTYKSLDASINPQAKLQLSWIRRTLGDQSFHIRIVKHDLTEAEVDGLQSAFPEVEFAGS